MRKLKLQFAHIPEGFAPTTNSEPINYCDEEFRNFSIANLEQVDCIILGRKTALDFIPYWAACYNRGFSSCKSERQLAYLSI